MSLRREFLRRLTESSGMKREPSQWEKEQEERDKFLDECFRYKGKTVVL